MATNKVKFYTAYGERRKQETPAGSQIEDQYGWVIDKYGQKTLEVIGQTNVWEKIQESLEETKIENILKRAAIGDESVFRPDGIYADISNTPKNLLEARQQMQQLENLWNTLDADIKRKYNNSVDKFIAQSGSQEWLIDMKLIDRPNIEPAKVETKGEVKDE